MFAASLTYLAAQQHMNDLRREADRNRRAAHARSAGRVRLAIPRLSRRRRAGAAAA